MTATYPAALASQVAGSVPGTSLATFRTPLPRTYLMCRPEHFTVRYAINPWMTSGTPVDTALAIRQWQGLRDAYASLGHSVQFIDGHPDLPDMVFAANGATVIGGTVWAPGSAIRSGPRKARPTWTGSAAAATARCTNRAGSTRVRATSCTRAG